MKSKKGKKMKQKKENPKFHKGGQAVKMFGRAQRVVIKTRLKSKKRRRSR